MHPNPRRARRYTQSVFLLFFALFILSCSNLTSVSRKDNASQPNILFEEPVYDFGIAGPDQKITHTFNFTNTGSLPLKIEKVGTSCACAAALLSAREIPPGSQGAVRAVFEPRRYKDKQEEIITVYSNGPENPEIDLTLKGLIKRDVAVVPQGINFSNIKKGQPASARVRLLELSADPLVIFKIQANEKYLKVSTSRFREENSRGINIDVTLKPEVPAGTFIEVITLHTNVKKRPKIDVPVWGDVIE